MSKLKQQKSSYMHKPGKTGDICLEVVCAVPNCLAKCTENENLRFYRAMGRTHFGINPPWVQLCGLKKLEYNSWICGRHFETRVLFGKNLRANAFPTLNMPVPADIIKGQIPMKSNLKCIVAICSNTEREKNGYRIFKFTDKSRQFHKLLMDVGYDLVKNGPKRKIAICSKHFDEHDLRNGRLKPFSTPKYQLNEPKPEPIATEQPHLLLSDDLKSYEQIYQSTYCANQQSYNQLTNPDTAVLKGNFVHKLDQLQMRPVVRLRKLAVYPKTTVIKGNLCHKRMLNQLLTRPVVILRKLTAYPKTTVLKGNIAHKLSLDQLLIRPVVRLRKWAVCAKGILLKKQSRNHLQQFPDYTETSDESNYRADHGNQYPMNHLLVSVNSHYSSSQQSQITENKNNLSSDQMLLQTIHTQNNQSLSQPYNYKQRFNLEKLKVLKLKHKIRGLQIANKRLKRKLSQSMHQLNRMIEQPPTVKQEDTLINGYYKAQESDLILEDLNGTRMSSANTTDTCQEILHDGPDEKVLPKIVLVVEGVAFDRNLKPSTEQVAVAGDGLTEL